MIDDLDDLNAEIEEAVSDAMDGSLSLEDLSELFKDYADRLLMLEQELIELELEPEEFGGEYKDEEEEEEGEY